jgi:uncharacterized protein (TIGR02118 family)
MSDAAVVDATRTVDAHGPVCLFLTFADASRTIDLPAPQWLPRIEPVVMQLLATPGTAVVRAHVPSEADDPYLKDTDVPALVLQSYFVDLPALQAACQEGSVLDAWLKTPGGAPAEGLGGAATWQVMSVERIALAAPGPLPPTHCTYLVAYEGTSADEAAWHAHYFEHHVPLMKRLPGLRRLEVYRPLATEPVAPALAALTPVRAMQRNQVVFDSPQALTAALNSPIRHEMRKDYQRSPPFAGRSTHYPMATRSWP